MQIADNTVVKLEYELLDSQGKTVEKGEEPIEYLQGHGAIFPAVEVGLNGKQAGESCEIYLQPSDAFGDYDEKLVHIETTDKFPDNVKVGMRFEGSGETSGETVVFTVTDIADGKVVVDGNHPFAGMSLLFRCKIESVRAATAEELSHGHVHGPHGHHHH